MASEHTPVLYVAPLLALGLLLLFLYRQVMQWLERKLLATPRPRNLDAPLLQAESKRSYFQFCLEGILAGFHYWTLLYVVCGYLIYDEYKSSFRLLQATEYLNPEVLRSRFEEETVPLPDWWQDEVKHMISDSGCLLRFLTLLSPVFLSLTFLVSLANTGRHVRKILWKGGLLQGNPGIDSSIMVIALPMISCMMAYRSVTRMWMICANSKVGSLGYVEDFQGHKSWVGRLVVCQNMYDTNFLLSDLYESWALLHFANLALGIITAAQNQTRFTRSGSEMMLQDKLNTSLHTMTKQGIYLFNCTCFVEALYHLVTTSVEAYLGGKITMEFNERVYRSRTRVHYFFLGMGAVASSAAIGNVVTVELSFEELLEGFRPSAKFWSTKILLSLGFMQSLLLEVPPLSTHLSVTEKDLFYASLLCVECFGVSLLHLVAWNPAEPWLDDLRKEQTELEPSAPEH